MPTAPALGAGPVPAVPAVPAPDAPAPPPAAKWAKGTEVSVAGLRIQCKSGCWDADPSVRLGVDGW